MYPSGGDAEGDIRVTSPWGSAGDACATVAHSFSPAMAKGLGCEDDGGVEADPSPDRL